MPIIAPIYTEKSECQDCYKCLRTCPVKAIHVEDGCATVMPEYCIFCGACVGICPNGAKKVRDDIDVARSLLQRLPRVIVSLAPSFVSEFPDVRPAQLIGALRRLGFYGVSETALGAQKVSSQTGEELRKRREQNERRQHEGDTRNSWALHEPSVLFSSACPTGLEYVSKYHPEHAAGVINLLSPMLTHCKMLRHIYGENIGIVFIGPCIAKKHEADLRADLVDVALTFEELRHWLDEEGIRLEQIVPTIDDRFVPEEAREGALYPISGGMAQGIKPDDAAGITFMCVSSLRGIRKALAGLEGWKPKDLIFVELLACPGGCVNGPKARQCTGTIRKRYNVLCYAKPPAEHQPPQFDINIKETLPITSPRQTRFTETEIREALESVGKYSRADERNCSGCGYDSCREFAQALLAGNAERKMCATYMRQLAQRASALMSKMPSAAVIVDDQLRIIDSNDRFRAMFVDHDVPQDRVPTSLANVHLPNVLPFSNLFKLMLETGQDFLERDIRYRDTVLHATIFTIDRHAVVGAILQDITESRLQKEQIISRAQEVIRKNLKTVQQIAFLLGENAAESEITLNSIVQSFALKDNGDHHDE